MILMPYLAKLAPDRVLITGGTGSLGGALLPEVCQHVRTVRVLSRDEVKRGDALRRWPNVEFQLGDVRDIAACERAVKDVDVIIHAASLKYVDVSERQPTEYILTNVFGTINLLNALRRHAPDAQVVGISTDKACNPINTYGLTKSLLEKLFVEASAQGRFTVARYGNVLGTRGSVVPAWAEAARRGQALRVTDPTMTRFFFTLADAVRLIDDALAADPGTIVSQAMPAATLGMLADVMAGPAGWKRIGVRPGEKQHEELISDIEALRTRTLEMASRTLFFYYPLALPSDSGGIHYTSEGARRLTHDEIATLVAPWR